MSIETKREQLLNFLKDINDEALIDRISEYVSSLKSVEEDMFTPMSEEELERRLAISRKDYEEGRYYTHDEVKDMVSKW